MDDTWNDSNVNYVSVKMDIDDQNSGPSSKILDCKAF